MPNRFIKWPAPTVSTSRRGKPFLRWAGSKRKQLSRLASFWSPNHTRYVEPFAGSACLFFELAPGSAVLGDSNEDLIEVYRVVCNEPERLYRRLCRVKRDLKTYRRWRQLNPKLLDRETRALRFLYLNRNCFNGIYRTNRLGDFNVPMGTRQGAYISKDDFLNCSLLLQNVTLAGGQSFRAYSVNEISRSDDNTAIRQRRVNDLGFSGGRLFQP